MKANQKTPMLAAEFCPTYAALMHEAFQTQDALDAAQARENELLLALAADQGAMRHTSDPLERLRAVMAGKQIEKPGEKREVLARELAEVRALIPELQRGLRSLQEKAEAARWRATQRRLQQPDCQDLVRSLDEALKAAERAQAALQGKADELIQQGYAANEVELPYWVGMGKDHLTEQARAWRAFLPALAGI
ncbi:hypothetical protein [Inhella sp.]|uniref:hypothetical protein n=1 Tax=Inhella sp. TaxID=1921806 RepID=UPI0035AEEB82